jgi:hypothetical protein
MINEELRAVLETLSTDQLRFVAARLDCSTDREAAERIGVSTSTVAHWPPAVRRAVELAAQNALDVALQLRRAALVKAMLVKVSGLESVDERIRQNTATEIIEWELGKAKQVSDINLGGQPGNPISIVSAVRALAEAEALLAKSSSEEAVEESRAGSDA